MGSCTSHPAPTGASIGSKEVHLKQGGRKQDDWVRLSDLFLSTPEVCASEDFVADVARVVLVALAEKHQKGYVSYGMSTGNIYLDLKANRPRKAKLDGMCIPPESLTRNKIELLRKFEFRKIGEAIYMLLGGLSPWFAERRVALSLKGGSPPDFGPAFKGVSMLAKDFVSGLLCTKGMSAAEALEHPWIASRLQAKDSDTVDLYVGLDGPGVYVNDSSDDMSNASTHCSGSTSSWSSSSSLICQPENRTMRLNDLGDFYGR